MTYDKILNKIEAGEKIVIIDLFCGAGGMSSGAIRALNRITAEFDKPVQEIAEVIAVNHWQTAIETHHTNYPWIKHFHTNIQNLRPRDLLKDDETEVEEGDEIDLLIACPDCTYFSPARGGGPKDPSSRATPNEVLDWVAALDVRNILFENVPQFRQWGPLDSDGYVIEEKKGAYFENWINALTIEGFAVDWRILNSADYGDATARNRLFIAGRKDSGIDWPDQTHSEGGKVPQTKPWRTTADILDFSDLGDSIFTRDIENGRRKPLVNSTMKRIAQGIREHGDPKIRPFADALEQIGREEVYQMRENAVPAEYAETVAQVLDEPFLAECPTAETDVRCLHVPSILGQQSGAKLKKATESPLPTVATRGAISTVIPETFVLPKNGLKGGLFSKKSYPASSRQLHTIVAGRIDQGYTINPYLVPLYSEREGQKPRTHSIHTPTPTIVASAIKQTLSQPFLVEYYGEGSYRPITSPLPTVTTKDRFALVVPELYPLGIDVNFRMLKPTELAAAMGFPEDYEFEGTKTETVKQIGNAVPVNVAASLCEQLLVGSKPTIDSFSNKSPSDNGIPEATAD